LFDHAAPLQRTSEQLEGGGSSLPRRFSRKVCCLCWILLRSGHGRHLVAGLALLRFVFFCSGATSAAPVTTISIKTKTPATRLRRKALPQRSRQPKLSRLKRQHSQKSRFDPRSVPAKQDGARPAPSTRHRRTLVEKTRETGNKRISQNRSSHRSLRCTRSLGYVRA